MKKLSITLLFALSIGSAYAAKPVTSGDETQACTNGLKVATGRPGVGFSNLFKNMNAAEICGTQIKLCEVKSEGGLDNLNILANKKADIGLASIDTVKDMSAGDENVAGLQAVATLNYNYLHVLTLTNGLVFKGEKKWNDWNPDNKVIIIKKFSDLKGKPVALAGSAQLMARALASRQLKDYNMQFFDVKDEAEAIAAVKAGRAYAAFITTGAPNGKLDKLTTADGITLVPFDEDVGGNYVVRKLNYKGMGVYNLKALAVQNVLLTRPFGAAKAQQVAVLKQCLTERLQDLKDGEYEPAWNEMRMDTNVDLPKFTAQSPQQAQPIAQKRK